MDDSDTFNLNATYQLFDTGTPGATTVDNEDVNFAKTPAMGTGSSISTDFEAADWDAEFDGNGITPWQLTTSEAHGGSYSVRVSEGNEGYLTSDDFDASDATAIKVDFWFRKDQIEDGEFRLYYYDGTNYDLIVDLESGYSDDEWHHYQHTTTDSQYFVSNFRIRFEGITSNTTEWSWVDDVTIFKQLPGAYWDWATYSGEHYWWTAADGTYSATWTPDLPSAGEYEVQARWHADATHSTSVEYTINHAGGSPATVTKNQQLLDGQWVTLGTWEFHSGTSCSVVLNHTRSGANDIACADAVRFLPVNRPDEIDIKRAHYYTWHDADEDEVTDPGEVYLVVLDGTIKYNVVTDSDGDDFIDAGEMWPEPSPPSDVQTGRTYAEERQNFANWYSFYRKRELTATAAISRVIHQIQGVQIGFYSINGQLVQPVLQVKSGGVDESSILLGKLYDLTIRSRGTPLRRGLEEVGEYYRTSSDAIGSSPYADADDGGACQQAFSIVMTDGYWNGGNPDVGNADGDDNTDFDGSPYGDTRRNTLADVAMRYYETDFDTDLADSVPTNPADSATHQHMVTYGVSFGVSGSLDPGDYDFDEGVYPTWPNPNDGDPQKIDDLWHAAVNGRGEFLSASNPTQLIDSLMQIMRNIEHRLASASSVSINGDQLYESLGANVTMFQASYSSDGWVGDVQAYALDPWTGAVNDTPTWSASDELEDVNWDSGRVIVTYDGTDGQPFRYDSLAAVQKAYLDADETTARDLLDYLRGDTSNEERNGGTFRNRSKRLGDIVHSSPVYKNGVVYAGGNDGMLHAFNATDGTELFSYVPKLVFPNLYYLADPDYAHLFYVDLTPVVADVAVAGIDTMLVGGLAKGARGYYALDISGIDSDSSLTEDSLKDRVLWEFEDSDDLGYSFSRPAIVKSNDDDHPWIVIFGNGYNSINSKAVLFVVDPSNGSVIQKLDTGEGSCNGLSTPVPVDTNYDGKVDYVYAGDLRGYVWKFDLTSDMDNQWNVAFNQKPLFQAKSAEGTEQPITTKPDVMYHCDKFGQVVVFGTGRYLGDSDFGNTNTQSIYGVWDYGDDEDNNEYLGSFDKASGKLANQPDEVTLLQQAEVTGSWTTSDGQLIRVLTDYTPYWGTIEDEHPGQKPNPGSNAEPPDTVHAGWYFDLGDGERVVSDVLIRDKKALVISFTPEQTPCGTGGDSIFQAINACTGGRVPALPVFDINDDGVINEDDLVDIGEEGSPVYVPPTGIGGKGRLQTPVILKLGDVEFNYLSSSTGDITIVKTKTAKTGMTYWMELD
jgi:type IV pilus assembly protein PilY1